MRIRTPTELGHLIREGRRRASLSQEALALQIGVSRQWVVEVEKGKSRAEVGLILRALDALDISLRVERAPRSASATESGPAPMDVDAIIEAHREPRDG